MNTQVRIPLVHPDLRLTHFADRISQILSLINSKPTAAQIVWDTGGGGNAKTWEEVYRIVKATASPCTIILQRKSTDPLFDIPPGIYEMKNCIFFARAFGDQTLNIVNMQDGAQLRNVKFILGSMGIAGNSTNIPCLENDPSTLFSPPIYAIGMGALLGNFGTKPMIVVPSGGFAVIASLLGSEFWNFGSPVVDLGVSGVLWYQSWDGTNNLNSDSIIGDAGSTLIISSNGELSASDNSNSRTSFPNFTLMSGAVLNTPNGTNGGSGPTLNSAGIAGRPSMASVFNQLTIGCSYFDTDLGQPIWFDGTQWVDATGTPV